MNYQIKDFTAIKDITIDTDFEDVYYNLNGIKVNNPPKGVYILNGKKVFIKN